MSVVHCRWDAVRHLVCSQRLLYWEVARRNWEFRELPESHTENPGTLQAFAEKDLKLNNLIRHEEIQVLGWSLLKHFEDEIGCNCGGKILRLCFSGPMLYTSQRSLMVPNNFFRPQQFLVLSPITLRA